MKYEEANVEIIQINVESDVITLSVIDNEEVSGENWWGNK